MNILGSHDPLHIQTMKDIRNQTHTYTHTQKIENAICYWFLWKLLPSIR